MTETTTLRAYLTDLNDMLERGAANEVVSHCRYILQRFPQNVETYRLLAQALLQRGQHEGISTHFDEASEVFQRVLSVVPNDYVAHYGLSAIFEEDGELDRAIWHMERAYEQLPGNQVLQDALRTLYGKRDGEQHAPAKIQLTRGALARQYVTGQLYDQALIELRNALQQDASRVDLEVMLCETLWESHHPVEAGEAAVRILKKLPSCLAAHRILARLWLENERPADAQRFLDRLEALDPYLAADVLQPDTEVYDMITIDRLDYTAQSQATLSQETPDWVDQLSGMEVSDAFSLNAPISSDVPEAEPEAHESMFGVPDWFADIGAAAPENTDAEAMPWDGDWLSSSDQPLTSDSEDAASLPDWFTESMGQAPESTPESAGDNAPLTADWLMMDDDEAPAFDEPDQPVDDFAAMFADMRAETTAEADTNLADLNEADWLPGSEEEADELTDFASMFDALSETEQPGDVAEAAPETAADWLSGSEEEADELTDFASMFDALSETEQPGDAAEAVPETAADWLSGSEEEADELTDFASMFDALSETEQPGDVAEAAPETAADWLSGSEEEADELTDFASMFDALSETEQPGDAAEAAPETAADWLFGDEDTDEVSGFTDLLAHAQASSHLSAEEANLEEELVPPEWLVPFEPFSASDKAENDVTLDWLQASPSPAEEIEDLATKTGEWLSALPELELESVEDEADAITDLTLGELAASPLPSEGESLDWSGADSEQEPETTVSEELPSEMAAESEAGLSTPYEPYESAIESGILQPDEAPDWMLALTGQSLSDEVDAFETDQSLAEQDDESESLFAALGFEMSPDESELDEEPVVESVEADEVEPDEEPFDLEQLAPPAQEEGAMPDWLAAITGPAQAHDAFDFGIAEEAEIPQAEISQSDTEPDWLTPVNERPERAAETFDTDELLAALGEIEETLGISERETDIFDEREETGEQAAAIFDEASDPFADFDFDTIGAEPSETPLETDTPAPAPLDDLFAEFDLGGVGFDIPEAEPTLGRAAETSEPEFAQLDNLAHTTNDIQPAEKFSFDDVTPRWLRKPKDAFEDDEND